VPVVSRELEQSILNKADALANTVITEATRKADTLTMPDGDEVTEGLLSQLKPTGKFSRTHLLPLGSNVYVRNYAH
jgi:hypothetical protein